MEKIIVSVYITTQNRPELLKRAIDSLKKQTYKNFEVLVCDDCSSEENQLLNKKIINSFHNDFIKITYLLNLDVKGACYSRNRAIDSAIGEYITGLDDDDIFHKERINLFMSFPDKEKYSFLSANCKKISSINDDQLRSGGEVIDEKIIRKYNAIGNQIFIKKEKISSEHGFDETMPAWQDYDTWFRLIMNIGPAYKMNACTMYLDDDEGRKRITTSSKAHQGYLRFIKKHSEKLKSDDLLSLYFMDKVNRKEKINYFALLKTGKKDLIIRVMKYSLTYQLPLVYSIYERFIK